MFWGVKRKAEVRSSESVPEKACSAGSGRETASGMVEPVCPWDTGEDAVEVFSKPHQNPKPVPPVP